MDNFLFNNPIIYISNGVIEDISSDNRTTFVAITYNDSLNNRQNQTIRLLVNQNTLILDEYGNIIPISDLTINMTINAAVSSAITRSIPPQSSAYMIRIVKRPISDNITIGRIIDIDREFRNITTISGTNPSSIIRFHIPTSTRIFDMFGQPIRFQQLIPGLRVQIRHASFMTASIPPQTTAFEIWVVG